MDNQIINYLLALFVLIILIVRKVCIVNLFTYEEKPNGTIRTCKKCGTRQWKSKIVGKWLYNDKNPNCKCNCRKYVES